MCQEILVVMLSSMQWKAIACRSPATLLFCCFFGLHWCRFVYGGPQPANYCARKNVQKTKVMQKVAGLPKAIESFYSCSTTLHTQARLTFKQTSLAYLFIRLQPNADTLSVVVVNDRQALDTQIFEAMRATASEHWVGQMTAHVSLVNLNACWSRRARDQ